MSTHAPQRQDEQTGKYWHAAPPPPRRASGVVPALAIGLAVGLAVALVVALVTVILTRPSGPVNSPAPQADPQSEQQSEQQPEQQPKQQPEQAKPQQKQAKPRTEQQTQPRITKPKALQQPADTTSVTDYGVLQAVTVQGGRMSIVVDRVTMLTGAAARKFEQAQDGDGWPVVNTSTRLRTFPLTAAAVLVGNQELGPHNGTQEARITVRQLQARTPARGVLVRLTHVGSLDGPVSRLSELYVP